MQKANCWKERQLQSTITIRMFRWSGGALGQRKVNHQYLLGKTKIIWRIYAKWFWPFSLVTQSDQLSVGSEIDASLSFASILLAPHGAPGEPAFWVGSSRSIPSTYIFWVRCGGTSIYDEDVLIHALSIYHIFWIRYGGSCEEKHCKNHETAPVEVWIVENVFGPVG